MSTLATALDLAGQGLAVFPCRADKIPATPHGFKDASGDPAGIRGLWCRYASPLIGLPTGEINDFDVLDIDPRHGGDAWLVEHAGQIPTTRQHSTRSGGRHILFRHHPGLRNSEGKLAPGVDTRGQGGYVIWWPGFGGDVIDPAPVAEWPAWLTDLLMPKPAAPVPVRHMAPLPTNTDAERFLSRVLGRLAAAPPGQRHRHLRAASCTLGGVIDQLQIPESTAFQQLFEAVQQAGGNEVDPKNAAGTIAWGLAKGRLSPLTIGGRHAR